MNRKSYNDKYEITFESQKHIYQVNNLVKPSATQILYHDKTWNIPKKTLEAAANLGTRVHTWIEQYINAKTWNYPLPTVPSEFRERNAINSFLKFIEQYPNIEWLAIEHLVYSEKYDYAGMTDAIFKLNDEVYVADFKTSLTFYDEYKSQLWAYSNAIIEEGIYNPTKKLCIRLNKQYPPSIEIKQYSDEGKDYFLTQLEKYQKLNASSTDNNSKEWESIRDLSEQSEGNQEQSVDT